MSVWVKPDNYCLFANFPSHHIWVKHDSKAIKSLIFLSDHEMLQAQILARRELAKQDFVR